MDRILELLGGIILLQMVNAVGTFILGLMVFSSKRVKSTGEGTNEG